VKPDPPPQAEVRRIGSVAVAASRTVPIVRAPDVAGHVGNHLDAAALEDVDDIAGLGAGGMPLGLAFTNPDLRWNQLEPI